VFSLAELSPDLGLLDKFKLFFQKITSNAIKDIDKSKLSKSYEKEKSFDVSEKENLQKDNVEDSRFGKIYDKDIDKFKDRDIVKIKPVSNNVLPVQQPVQQEIFNYPSSISDYHLHESIREDPLISGGLKEVFYIKTGDKRLAKDEYQLQTINGCMDELAINYNYLANEVGSCEYFSLITGLLSVSGYDYDSVVPGDYIANAIMFESSGYEQVDNVQLKVDSAFHSVCENDLGYGAGVSGCCHEWTAGVPETCFSESTEQCDGGACIQNPKPFVTTEWIDVDDFENVQGNIWTAYTYLDVISNGIEESLEDWGDYESWSGQFFHIHTKISGSESSPVYIGSWEYPTAQEPSAFPTEFFILNEDCIGVFPLIAWRI